MNAPLANFGLCELLDANPMVGEPRQGGRRFWTMREEKLLRESFPAGGVAACLPLLPGRSAKSIYCHAGLLGLHSPLGKKDGFPRQRWQASEQIDAVIRRAYQRTPARNDIAECARAVGRPRWWVSKRAQALGLVAPRFKEPAWTAEEEQIVADNFHKQPDVIVRILAKRGFKRSATAVVNKGKRLGATREDPNHVNAGGLATLMGIDPKSVARWIDKGLLVAKRRGTDRTAAQGGDLWWIHYRDVRRFIIENAAAVDLRKVDKFWFIELLGRGHQL